MTWRYDTSANVDSQITTGITTALDAYTPPAPGLPFSLGGLYIDYSGNVAVGSVGYPGYATFSRYYGTLGGSGYGATLAGLNGEDISFSLYAGYVQFWVNGSMVGAIQGTKSFVIDHPTDPDRYLVHACLEGPEAAVFYRGETQLDADGRAEVILPDYFAALTRPDSATVQLTPVLEDENDPVGPVAGTRVRDGRFVIRGPAGQHVCWRVEAERADVPRLVAEPLRRDVRVRGSGPYRWLDSRR